MADHSETLNRWRVMRELADDRIQDGAAELDVSYTYLWNVENGFCKLTDRQAEQLEAFYMPKVNLRLKAISAALNSGR